MSLIRRVVGRRTLTLPRQDANTYGLLSVGDPWLLEGPEEIE